jgi:hypothetical protein
MFTDNFYRKGREATDKLLAKLEQEGIRVEKWRLEECHYFSDRIEDSLGLAAPAPATTTQQGKQ